MSPLFQGLDDCKELPIVDVIILLRRREGGGMISTGMEVSVGVLLHEYPSRGSKGGISHDEEGLGGVQHFDYWGQQECFFELDKSVVLLFSPVKGHPLFSQIVEQSGECGEVQDELSVEVTEPNKGSDCFDRLGWFPLFNCLKFGGVHEYLPILDY